MAQIKEYQGKYVLSISGGLDSSTLLGVYEDNIGLCVFFNYGSKQNKRELKAATEIATFYKKDLLVIDAKNLFACFKSPLLAHSDQEIELGSYDDKEESNAKVPFRNGIFISILLAIAEEKGFDGVMAGVHAGDHRLYADCTPSFIASFDMLSLAYNPKLRVIAPFVYLTKGDIAKFALAYNVPVEKTYSCYLGGETHCGKCPTCIERAEALGLFNYLN